MSSAEDISAVSAGTLMMATNSPAAIYPSVAAFSPPVRVLPFQCLNAVTPRPGLMAATLVAAILSWSGVAQAEDSTASTEALAKAAQNPVADMISVPFQFNTNFGYGPYDKTQEVINIQPVIPFSLSPDWNLITRTIVPVISQPQLSSDDGRTFGLGDITPTFFLSPAHSGKFIWGVGPAFLLPTATDEDLGSGKWGAGPSAVGLIMDGPWVYGALINNIWSFAGDPAHRRVGCCRELPCLQRHGGATQYRAARSADRYSNQRPSEPGLVVRRTATVTFAPYALNNGSVCDDWIACTVDTPSARWVRSHRRDRIRVEVSNPRSLLDLALAGAGQIVLPCFVGATHESLIRTGPVIEEISHEQWLVVHGEDRTRSGVRETIDAIARLIAAKRALFAPVQGA